MSDMQNAEFDRRLSKLLQGDGVAGIVSTGSVLKISDETFDDVRKDALAQYTHDTGLEDVVSHHLRWVVYLAGSFVLQGEAAQRSGDGNSTLKSDSVDHGSAADRYAARAREWRNLYNTGVGVSDAQRTRLAPTGVVVNLYSDDDEGGNDAA